jgi:Putative prokaryotic signal transducing protein
LPAHYPASVQRLRMVPLLRADGAFHARVVSARLGSEGILTQLRGSVDGPYPMGAVEVLVSQDDLALARELLLADEVETALAAADEGADAEGDEPAALPGGAPWLLVLGVALLLVVALVAAVAA